MKTQTITIRVGAMEKIRLEREAQQAEMNVSEYIRFLIQKGKDKIFLEDYERALKEIEELEKKNNDNI